MSIVIAILTFALILISLFLILVVLAQKAKSDGGVGAAMGGGMAEAAFGADTGNVLSKSTIYAAIAFFAVGLVLYLVRLHEAKGSVGGSALPNIPVSSAPVSPSATPAATPDGAPSLSLPAAGSNTAAPAAQTPAVPAATPPATAPTAPANPSATPATP